MAGATARPGRLHGRQTKLQVNESGSWQLQQLEGKNLTQFKENIRKWWNEDVIARCIEDAAEDQVLDDNTLCQYPLLNTKDLFELKELISRQQVPCSELPVVRGLYERHLAEHESQLQGIIQRIRSNDPDLQADLDEGFTWETRRNCGTGGKTVSLSQGP